MTKGHFKGRDNHRTLSGVLSCSDTNTGSETAAKEPETAVCLFPEAAERAVSRLKAVAQLCVLVSVHERTPLNIQ